MSDQPPGSIQTIIVKEGPNSFQSCMGCFGGVFIALIILMLVFT